MNWRLLGAALLFMAGMGSVTEPHAGVRNDFASIDELLPTPNDSRIASGAPGPGYWQQRADYRINVELDEAKRAITASAKITYRNNSPHSLAYLWLQLEQNRYRPDSSAWRAEQPSRPGDMTYDDLARRLAARSFAGGLQIKSVRSNGADLPHQVIETIMRLDLPTPLGPGAETEIEIAWSYNLVDQRTLGGRSGYEYFATDGNHIFQVATWYPRLAAYTDYGGWQTRPYLGSSEFSLEFGDYEVAITVPADHLVAATGSLQNPEAVLTDVQRQRLDAARTAKKPVFIVTPDEATAAERGRAARKKTWVFKAENVRDFAFASSRKFIWDAWGHNQKDGPAVMAMSFYPREAMPLWDKYATHAIVHALEEYGRRLFPYPYPTAQMVSGSVYGMEFPMIAFASPRPEVDREGRVTYSRDAKYGLISIILHEVAHNWFPMIINSDEREWAWMDEGIATFLQYLAEQSWEKGYPSVRGDPRQAATFMTLADQVPVMTPADAIPNLGDIAYGKPATALTVLRETVLGRDLFDFAFREYARRWQFKRPTPADFFRTMEDASGHELGWFWRGWFYGTGHVDLAIADLRRFRIDSRNPAVERERQRKSQTLAPPSAAAEQDRDVKRRTERYPELRDFYNEHDDATVTPRERADYEQLLATLSDAERALLKRDDNLYFLDIENLGGLVTPVILEITYADNSRETVRLPAEFWRRDRARATKLIITPKEIREIVLDPRRETADADLANNHWPRRTFPETLRLQKPEAPRNLMRELP